MNLHSIRALTAACVLLTSAAVARAAVITQTDNFGPLGQTLSNLTTGGPYTFATDSPAFNLFDTSLGTLLSATLNWEITGTEDGTGNFAGTGIFSYAGQSQTVTFDTVTDPGPKNFDFTGTKSLTLASVIGTGTFAPSTFTATMSQSGYFPWSGSMTDILGTVSLSYTYSAAGVSAVPEPPTDLLFAGALAGLMIVQRRKKGRAG